MKKLKLLLTLILVLSLDLNAQLDCNGFIIQDQTITTTTTDQSNCPDLSQGFTVSLDGSQTGVSYVVRNPETQANVSSMEAGTGGPLQFNISTSEERVDYRVVGIGGSDPGALSFDGVDDRLDLGTGSRGLFRSLTASIWVKTTQSGATSLLTKYPSAGGNAAGFRLAMDTNGKVFFQGRALGQPSRSSGESTTSINDGSWHYITGTVQIDNSSAGGETWKIYVDGVEENSLTTGSLLANLGTAIPLIAGGDDSDSFVGEIDQIAMWNTVLSATTIANFNDGCVDLGNPNLAAFYTLDEVEDGIFKDFSQVDADASFVNGDTFDAQSEGQIVCTLSGCSFSQCYVTPSCEYLLTDQVRLGDFTPPNAIANALTTFVIPSSGTLNINASQLDNGSADDCTAVADLMFSVSPSTFTCVDAGIQNVQFTVTDEDGNSATVSTQVEIVGPIADQTVTLRGGSFCPDGNSVATVDLFGSQVGVDYSLIDSDDNTILAGPVVGTGGPISLTTGSLTVSRTAYVEGKAGATQGSAIAFDGVDDRLFLGNDFRNISNQVTVALWVKTTSTTGETLVQKLSSNSGFRIFMDTQGRVRIDGRNGAAALKNSPYSTTAINDGQWHLVVGRVTLGSLGSNDLWSISVDGVSEGSGGLTNTGVFTPSLASGNMLEVGGDVNRNFDGEIDQIAIFNRYLTDNEVSNIQSNGCDIADTLPGVVAFFNLDEGEGTSLNDASSLAIGGTASLDTATAWVTGNLAC
ncbi:MAG: LamG domain-containing protein, partial [Cyclobacteriaceae bacterium]|nr:LamG domain-containing protein [Cyclobacteriaceae bacterium HetDA_MAG_MS6]